MTGKRVARRAHALGISMIRHNALARISYLDLGCWHRARVPGCRSGAKGVAVVVA